jgi:hypothetical protein
MVRNDGDEIEIVNRVLLFTRPEISQTPDTGASGCREAIKETSLSAQYDKRTV